MSTNSNDGAEHSIFLPGFANVKQLKIKRMLTNF